MTTIVTVALAVLFVLSGASKLLRQPISLVARDKLAVPPTMWSLIGAAMSTVETRPARTATPPTTPHVFTSLEG
jgi:hypothetical protein